LLASNPKPGDQAAVMEGFIELGTLKGNLGAQNYPIPAGEDIARFKSAVIYCKAFHVVFATATLQ
jgi:Electron transfer DM13